MWVKLKDIKRSCELLSMLGLKEDMVTLVRRSRLRWYGQVLRRIEGEGIRRVLELEVEGETRRGRPNFGWREQVEKDRVKAGLAVLGKLHLKVIYYYYFLRYNKSNILQLLITFFKK